MLRPLFLRSHLKLERVEIVLPFAGYPTHDRNALGLSEFKVLSFRTKDLTSENTWFLHICFEAEGLRSVRVRNHATTCVT